MFLFSKKHKTPVSTYTDSYRPPYSVKKAICDRGLLEAWKENKFVTPVSAVRGGNLRVDAQAPQDTAACHLHIAEKYRSVVVGDDKHMSWRTSPSTTAWSKESSYLPLLPKVDCACTMPVSIRLTGWLLLLTLTFPHYPCASEKAVVTDMLHKVPVYTMTGRIPFQNYYIPCSGRHCCLRGIDYYLDGTPATRKKLFAVEERAVRNIPCCHHHSPRTILHAFARCRQPSLQCRMPRCIQLQRGTAPSPREP
uniref:Sperm microtubule inner protein 6 n=1 Tax=Strigops habroptila TaxID=2489341 RepID=A0A672V7Q9_STRHB